MPHPTVQPTDLRLVRLSEAIRSANVKVVSTDVFDTLTWRQVPEPVDAFPLVGERLRARGALSESLTPRAFGRLRRIAERHAREGRRQATSDSEVRLAEIYERLPPWVLAFRPRHEGVQTEMEVEAGLVVPDLDVVALLAEAQEAGKRIVAVSDTYFSEEQLRELLDQPLLADLEFERVFTSSDHRLSKSGDLFGVVLRSLSVDPSEVVHLGDNRETDVDRPEELGIGAHFFERLPEPFSELLEAERPFMPEAGAAADSSGPASGLTATRAKALTRASIAAVPDALQPYWRYGASVLGPVFTGFAEWVAEYCARMGVRKLACLMREGAFLSQLMLRAAPYVDVEVRALPLWVNRDLCLRASIAEGSRHELERLLARRSVPTVAGLCELLGIRLAGMPEWAMHAHTSLEDPVVRHNFLTVVSSEERVRSEVVQRSRRLRERIAAYVDDFCDGEEGTLTLLDLGWGASIQALLQRTLAEAGAARPTVGLYLVTHQGAGEQVVQGIEAHGFLGEYGLPDGPVTTIMRSPELLEQVCMPPHGTQTGLTEEFEPVLAPTDLPRLQLVEAETVRKGALAYQREWARYQTTLPGKVGRLSAVRHLLRPILLRSVVAPTKQEVTLFGSWQHDEGQGSSRTDPIVDPADVDRLRYMNPAQARELPMTDLYWPYATGTLVDDHWPALTRLAASGQLSWDALGAPVETGSFALHATGVDVPETSAIVGVPTRNRYGLSSVIGSIRAPFVQELHIRPAEHAAIVRIDWIELRCHVQGQDTPIHVRFDVGSGLSRWNSAQCFVLAPGVYISYEGTGRLALPLSEVTRRVVFRVDVECAFAILPIPTLLPAGGRFGSIDEAARALHRLESSLSWRLTAPLRTVKRKLR